TEVTRMLADNRHLVEALRDALLHHDELIGDQILDTLKTAQTPVLDVRSHALDEDTICLDDLGALPTTHPSAPEAATD
ncbi:MAG TPA: hypothetical protein VFA11_17600, partial [Acidimicrobiales bacterium]|nr:hypothetical protein [Acidimicrobiales bacterium]